tara:strand:+ start:1972 stop:2901 length:930 start_codon:yes stop_codon:yes gene_type:complete
MNHIIKLNTELYKSVNFPCKEIVEYMKTFPDQSCGSNKMIWLSENKSRALSYGFNLKIFKTKSDIELWNLMREPYLFQLEHINDEEFKGIMQSILRLFGDTFNNQCISLYGFLTGSSLFSVRVQLSLLKSIYTEMIDNEKDDLTFNEKTISQLKVTPDSKSFKDVLKKYIEIGDNLNDSELKLKNQRLSIYGLDQILLKLMCFNEKENDKHGIKGWYIPSGTQTVWKELIDGKLVSDMGEIALFNCNNLIECTSERASLKKSKRRRKSKRKKKKSKRKKKKSKRKFKRLTKKGKEWAKSMSNFMKQKRK